MQLATAIALVLGGIVTLRSFIRALGLRAQLTDPRYATIKKICGSLIGLFIAGYLAAATLVWVDAESVLLPVVGAILLSCAFAFHAVVYASDKLLATALGPAANPDSGDESMASLAAPRGHAGTRDRIDHPAPKRAPEKVGLTEPLTSPTQIASAHAKARKSRKFIDPDGTEPTRFPPKRRDSRVRRYSGTFRMGDTSTPQVDTAPAPATILVVDDSHINRTILDSYLERLGHRGILIGDGTSALSVLETNNSIELVLLDYWLPDMEGIEILHQMKATDLHKDTPVLMLSSEDDSETIAQCIEAGADDFLSKPFAPRLLQARIDACLNKSRFRARELQFVARLENERKRSEELLRVILPAAIAKELTETNRVKPRRYENVAVMFADISGFTAYCDKQRPEHVLSHLQSIVIAFEQLADQYSVQKIKTIGDSFMAASGLLHEVDDPVLRCVEMGMAMIKVVERAVPEWNLRIGVHTGPVVAGIVGRSQFLFDIWGDTVNTASRIESMASENGICVSARAWEEIKDHVVGVSLGLMHAKGKGDLELFRVDGLRAIPAVAVDDAPERKVGGYTVH